MDNLLLLNGLIVILGLFGVAFLWAVYADRREILSEIGTANTGLLGFAAIFVAIGLHFRYELAFYAVFLWAVWLTLSTITKGKYIPSAIGAIIAYTMVVNASEFGVTLIS